MAAVALAAAVPPALAIAPVVVGARALAPAAAASPAVEQHLARGEQHYAAGRLERARGSYLAALSASPEDFETLCRLVRVEAEMSEQVAEPVRDGLAAEAMAHARQLVRHHPDSARAHVWYAIALGRRAQERGFLAQVQAARSVKSELDLAIRLDPRNDRAYHARGLLHRRVAGMNAAERAAAAAALGELPLQSFWNRCLHDLRKAAELDPLYVKHHLELGRTYLLMGRYPDARRALQRSLELEPTSSGRDRAYQEEARVLLKELAGKG